MVEGVPRGGPHDPSWGPPRGTPPSYPLIIYNSLIERASGHDYIMSLERGRTRGPPWGAAGDQKGGPGTPLWRPGHDIKYPPDHRYERARISTSSRFLKSTALRAVYFFFSRVDVVEFRVWRGRIVKKRKEGLKIKTARGNGEDRGL